MSDVSCTIFTCFDSLVCPTAENLKWVDPALQVEEVLAQQLLDIIDSLKGGILGDGHSWVG